MTRKYYEAYDDRYRQVHERNLHWFYENPSAIVTEIVQAFSVSAQHTILEIGCGEGRDAIPLLRDGYNLLATDVSPEAVAYCRKKLPDFAEHFQVLDCIAGETDEKFDFIYAVAVVHMLVPDEDRNAFYGFIREHLTQDGIALICTMGDGIAERQTDIRTAFDLQERVHEESGEVVSIAGTSCRIVNFQTFGQELDQNGLAVLKQGVTSVEPNFPSMMYAVVKVK